MTQQFRLQNYRLGYIALTFIALICLISLTTFTGTVIFLLPVISAIILYVLLTRFPEFSIAMVVGGFYFYPLLFDLVGLPTSSTVTFGYWAVFSSAALIGFWRSWQYTENSTFDRFTLFAFLGFIIWHLLLWALLSNFSEQSNRRMAFAAFMMIAPFLSGQLMTREQIKRTLTILIMLGICGGLIGLNRFVGSNISASSRYTVSDSAGILIFAYAQGATALLLLVRTQSRNNIFLWAVGIIYTVIAVFLIASSGSRGSLVALIVCSVAIYTFRSNWSQRIKFLFMIAIFASITPVLMPFVPDFALDRVLTFVDWLSSAALRGNALIAEDATGNRSIVWAHSIDIWKENPWAGVGLAGLEGRFLGSFSHNFILELLVEQGIVGLILFLAVMWRIVLSAIRLYITRYSDEYVLSILALTLFALINISLSGRLQAQPMFWWLAGVILSMVAMPMIENQQMVVLQEEGEGEGEEEDVSSSDGQPEKVRSFEETN